MAHLNEILEAAKGKIETLIENGMVGFRFKKQHTWHWFTIYGHGAEIHFNHSYSMNTGKIKRGTMHNVHVSRSIQNIVGINFWNP